MSDSKTHLFVKDETLVHVPPNEKFYIDSVWAFVSEDAKGNEGIVAHTMGATLMPLIAADEERLRQLRPYAEKLAKMGLVKIKLVKFHQRTEVETIAP
jgi:hypothetical protein